MPECDDGDEYDRRGRGYDLEYVVATKVEDADGTIHRRRTTMLWAFAIVAFASTLLSATLGITLSGEGGGVVGFVFLQR